MKIIKVFFCRREANKILTYLSTNMRLHENEYGESPSYDFFAEAFMYCHELLEQINEKKISTESAIQQLKFFKNIEYYDRLVPYEE